ncbi:MAG: hypothetical protein AAFV29_14260 [Myxococcota bacterium]
MAGTDASPEADRWAAELKASNVATPDVADVIARSLAPPARRGTAWTTATFVGITAAGAATARAIAVMNEAPGATPWLPWWVPLAVCVPALLAIVVSQSQARTAARVASLQAAARLGLELLNCGVPPSLATGIAAYLYELEPQDEQRLSAVEPSVDLDERQRTAMTLAVLAGKHAPERNQLIMTTLAAGLLFAVFVFFLMAYFGLLDGGLSLIQDLGTPQ